MEDDVLMLEAQKRDEEKNLGWVITQKSKRNPSITLYLVDRTYFSEKWWSSKFSEAMRWKSEFAVNKAANKLKGIKIQSILEIHEQIKTK